MMMPVIEAWNERPGSLRDALHNATLASDDEQLAFLEPTFLTQKSEGAQIFR